MPGDRGDRTDRCQRRHQQRASDTDGQWDLHHHPCHKIQDGAGHSMWSVNITIGAEDDVYVTKIVPYYAYAADGEPPTLFR